ncbi:unnamed protein product [Rotaria sp. Silwood2]|nr:unnamed protein product [Rotaria sp. Silwood2]CAF4450080.1 unnamed protein product [Rotaria sp. Silwood2]
MLKMLSSVERISQLIPKLKQQLIFLEERDKLFRKINDDSIPYDELPSNESTKSKPPVLCPTNSQSSSIVPVNSTVSYSTHAPDAHLASKISIDNSKFDQTVTGIGASSSFPDEYQIPPLPKALQKDIEAGVLTNFRPHFQGQQILIDAVVHDLIENYNLL